MLFPEFIIETTDEYGDCLIIGRCTYHKDIVINKDQVKGGGWWNIDNINNIITFFGESVDFNQAQLEDIKNCVKRKTIFIDYALLNNISNDYLFQYRDNYGEITKLN